ncbi:hypothetical protein HAX54_003391 [Datura stramonium]|uniref:Uncharacterized protein n=1 Tax=Datura stramonium TaxID=4076 RepID=A0ABS8WUL1_DATST|nr:hypothetical protein [Datura stramonium]
MANFSRVYEHFRVDFGKGTVAAKEANVHLKHVGEMLVYGQRSGVGVQSTILGLIECIRSSVAPAAMS